MTTADLKDAFEAFASFGAPRNLAPSATSPAVSHTSHLDSFRFAKLARDTGLIVSNVVTLVDIDIIFNKCKGSDKNSPRKLDFAGFKKALKMVAEKRGCNYDHVVALVIAGQPTISGTIPDVDPIIEKLTDTSLYTGTHKQRFDPETGVGLGLEGRDTVSKTNDLSKLVSRHNPNKTLGATSAPNTPPKTPPTAVKSVASASSSPAMAKTGSGTPTKKESAPASPATSSPASASPSSSSTSVFDRLTSVNSFTGSHKHRFNADGTGRGKEGRTGDGSGEVISDLTQTLRK